MDIPNTAHAQWAQACRYLRNPLGQLPENALTFPFFNPNAEITRAVESKRVNHSPIPGVGLIDWLAKEFLMKDNPIIFKCDFSIQIHDASGDYVIWLDNMTSPSNNNKETKVSIKSFSAHSLEESCDLLGRYLPEFIYAEVQHQKSLGN